MKSPFTNEQINEVMKQRKITRKSAMKFLRREHSGTKAAVAPAKDVKMAAANDLSTQLEGSPKAKANAESWTDAQVAKQNKKALAKAAKAPTPTMTPEERGKARAEGLRLYVLAGKPKKSDFIKVYGKRGHLMTWTEREEAGVAAKDFQKALAAKRGQ